MISRGRFQPSKERDQPFRRVAYMRRFFFCFNENADGACNIYQRFPSQQHFRSSPMFGRTFGYLFKAHGAASASPVNTRRGNLFFLVSSDGREIFKSALRAGSWATRMTRGRGCECRRPCSIDAFLVRARRRRGTEVSLRGHVSFRVIKFIQTDLSLIPATQICQEGETVTPRALREFNIALSRVSVSSPPSPYFPASSGAPFFYPLGGGAAGKCL